MQAPATAIKLVKEKPLKPVINQRLTSYILMNSQCCRILVLLSTRFDGDYNKMSEWLNKPNRHFEGQSPRQMINHERASRVIELLNWSTLKNGPID